MTNNIIAQFEGYDRKIFWALAVLAGIFMLAYVYFLSISVHAVIVRKESEQESGRITSRISELESSYVALDKGIDLALAREAGFVDIAVPRYVSRGTPSGVLTLRDSGDIH